MQGHKTDKPIFSAKDVEIRFTLRGKELTAVRGASLDLYPGETLAIVGESGCGKSVFTKSFIGMLDKNGRVTGGTIHYNDEELTAFTTEAEWLRIRGKKIAMVFQDPMTSLNPFAPSVSRSLKSLPGTLAPSMSRRRRKPSSFCVAWVSTTPSAAIASIHMSSPAVCASVSSLRRPLLAAPKF